MNTKQVVPALVAVTLLSLIPASEALALRQNATEAKAASTPQPGKTGDDIKRAEDKNAPAPASAAVRTDEAAPTVADAQKAYDAGSYEEAFIIVEPLAKMNHPEAEYLLGQMYELGRGVKKDSEKGPCPVFTAAANQGYAAAQAKLGSLHVEGKKDYASAMNWFQKAADQATPSLHRHRSISTPRDTVWSKNQDKAIDYYKKAARRATRRPACVWGRWYEQGKGVKARPRRSGHMVQEGSRSRLHRMRRRPEESGTKAIGPTAGLPARPLAAVGFSPMARRPRNPGGAGGRSGAVAGAGPNRAETRAGRGPDPHRLPLRLDVPRQCRMLSCATGIRTVADSAKRMRTWAKVSLSSNLPPR